jgi:glycine/D-amino acid oxidase-like deaminating enzyme
MSRSSEYDFGEFGDITTDKLRVIGRTGDQGTHLVLDAGGYAMSFTPGTAERIAKTILDFLEIADRDEHQDSETLEDYK